jgi:hypothetical protein
VPKKTGARVIFVFRLLLWTLRVAHHSRFWKGGAGDVLE